MESFFAKLSKDVVSLHHLTSKEGRNLTSFSTATTFLAPALRMDLVRDPGPGPTSQTQQSWRLPATFTILSEQLKEISVKILH